ncbi:hypothetical protein HOO54_20865 [Bacillus sp. WMMC1349]|uniref:hypothetical protein n=1 Tax=Bacillus sp. WMMC1349 TaxID=2736254 RepID=UPI0015558A47|nr:hypothetical protein [Bacillus sp. WMMC1349]NPC94610.1 hypothetical protein [Bacillus sp. WMMC1349]
MGRNKRRLHLFWLFLFVCLSIFIITSYHINFANHDKLINIMFIFIKPLIWLLSAV